MRDSIYFIQAGGILCGKLKTFSGSYLAFTSVSRLNDTLVRQQPIDERSYAFKRLGGKIIKALLKKQEPSKHL